MTKDCIDMLQHLNVHVQACLSLVPHHYPSDAVGHHCLRHNLGHLVRAKGKARNMNTGEEKKMKDESCSEREREREREGKRNMKGGNCRKER